MEIAPGTEIGPYVVDREIGRGGMGVVYAATDSRLGRAVAIKALPAEFAADIERLARFEREARTLASLNHPNVAQIFGVEEKDGARYLVLELVEGQTLSERLDNGPLPPEEAVELMLQVARGLGAAHEAGIIHRDLKPANIKLAGDGTAKVLDFGLARSDEGLTSTGSSVSQMPTLTTPAGSPTMAGAIMGTAPYMSPEQARGRKTDKRTDIWSFGVVLYECLTGAGPFIGETVTDSLGAILHKDVDLDQLPPGTPARVRHVLGRCLDRDRNRRFYDINDARIELESGTEVIEAAPRSSALRVAAVSAAMLIAGVGLAWGLSQLLAPAPELPEPVRFLIEPAGGLSLDKETGPPYAISPDGARIAVLTQNESGGESLWLRELSADAPTLLASLENGSQPVFSRDGQWVAYFTDTGLWKVAVSGGTPLKLADTESSPRGAVWLADGRITFAPNTTSPLMVVDEGGGEARPLTTLEEEGQVTPFRSHRWPSATPDGRWVVYTAQRPNENFSNSSIWAINLETGASAQLHAGGAYPLMIDYKTLLFVRDGVVYAARVDWSGPSLATTPKPVQSEVGFMQLNGGAEFAVSFSGLMIYTEGAGQSRLESIPTWIDLDTGETTPFLDRAQQLDSPRISPDGSRVAFHTISISDPEIRVYESTRKVMNRVPTPGGALVPIWRPGHDQLLMTMSTEGTASNTLHFAPADGEGNARPLTPGRTGPQYPMDVSHDGRWLSFIEFSSDTEMDIWRLDLNEAIDQGSESPTTELLVGSAANDSDSKFSPDGEWIAYGSYISGQREVYIRRLEGPSMRTQISIGGGEEPAWSPDGSSIYYLASSERTELVPYLRVDLTEQADGTLEPTLPVEVARLPITDWGAPFPRMHHHPTLNRVLVMAPKDPDEDGDQRFPTHAVINWTTHVDRVLGDD